MRLVTIMSTCFQWGVDYLAPGHQLGTPNIGELHFSLNELLLHHTFK